jgi:hypothetical protein
LEEFGEEKQDKPQPTIVAIINNNNNEERRRGEDFTLRRFII